MKSQFSIFETKNQLSWIPISPFFEVTSAIENRIYSINNQTVLSLYKKYLGNDTLNTTDPIAINFPLIFHRNGIKIGLLPEQIYDDGSFLLSGNIFEGETVQLGIVNTSDAPNETELSLAYYKSLIHLAELTSSELNERVSLEIAKNEKNLQILLEQSRLATMGGLIDMISHQWRQPLMNMSIITSSLSIKAKMNLLDNIALSADIPQLESQIHYLSQTIDDFKNLFQTDATPVHTTFTEMAVIFESILGHAMRSESITLNLIVARDSSFIIFNNQLMQALLSIIQNSKDIIQSRSIKDGSITLYFDIIRATDKCYLTIQDNAGGISSEHLENIFEPYFTTEEDQIGSSFSLFIAKTIIEKQLNGTIYVENTSEGTSFRIEFPTNMTNNQNYSEFTPPLEY